MDNKSTIVRLVRVFARLGSAVAPRATGWLLARLFTSPRRFERPEREDAWLQGSRRERIELEDGRGLAVRRWGRSGPVVLLVHGWQGRGSQLGAVVAPLRARGFQVVSFDQPAHGASDGDRTALPDFARVIGRVIDEVGPVYAIVAHSMGGAATTLALSWGARAERLVYVAPPEDPPGYLARLAGELGFSDAAMAAARETLEARYGVPLSAVTGGVLAPHRTEPLRIIHDRGDKEVPFSEGARLAALWPGAELVPTDDLGHKRILYDDAVVDSIVGFVSPEPVRASA
jgi:pimeloyl-ACP methyl ester carboxylesterase